METNLVKMNSRYQEFENDIQESLHEGKINETGHTNNQSSSCSHLSRTDTATTDLDDSSIDSLEYTPQELLLL